MTLLDRWKRLSVVSKSALALLALFAVASLDCRPHAAASPHELLHLDARGPLLAGAGKADLTPPFPTPLGGYNTRGNTPYARVLDPVTARALVVDVGGTKLGLVSLEVVVVPASLRHAVEAAAAPLGLGALVVTATHTHSGPGGYWDKWIAEEIGLAAYDPRVEAHLVLKAKEALEAAVRSLTPARVAWARLQSNYSTNRALPHGVVDQLLTGIRFDALDGAPLARWITYASHPTMLPQEPVELSADWPGSLSRAMEADTGAVVLFTQGAGGDATWNKRSGGLVPVERMKAFGEAFAADARGAIAAAGAEGASEVRLSFTREAFHLPPASVEGAVWGPFEPLAANLMQWLVAPGETSVDAWQLGPVRLLFVPGEPVGELGLAWRKAFGGASVVGLADDYVGYVETEAHVAEETGESQRQYFEGELVVRLTETLGLAAARTFEAKE